MGLKRQEMGREEARAEWRCQGWDRRATKQHLSGSHRLLNSPSHVPVHRGDVGCQAVGRSVSDIC